MDFWKAKVNVSKEAATRQIQIINKLPAKKRFRIALDFGNLAVEQTRNWIRENNPTFSEHEITLEYVKLIYYDRNDMSESHWNHFKKVMEEKIQT